MIEKVEANKIRVTVSACGGPPDMSGVVSHVSKYDTASSRDSPCLAPVTAWSHAVLWLPLPMENYF